LPKDPGRTSNKAVRLQDPFREGEVATRFETPFFHIRWEYAFRVGRSDSGSVVLAW